jgi:predicted NAD/FAD-dependent oxidoreductase
MNYQSEVLIIGAGVSGLLVGEILSQNGIEVMILEKSRGVGGLMATRRFKQGVFDHGAQFFTARDTKFQHLVDLWIKEKVARVWYCSSRKLDDQPNDEGHPRYRGRQGMTSVAKYLARDLDIRLQTHVKLFSKVRDSWIAQTENGEEFIARQIVLSAPIPQSLNLLASGDVDLPALEYETLKAIEYLPCITGLVLLSGPSAMPSPGGIKFDESDIQWLGDNSQIGISPISTAVTIHASHDFSQKNFDLPAEELIDLLVEPAKTWLGQKIQDWQIYKWRYSQPVNLFPAQFLEFPKHPGLFMIGDAFGGARIEGAALSGIELAFHLRKQYKIS